MPWYSLYDKLTGRLHSLGTVLAEEITDGLEAKELSGWGTTGEQCKDEPPNIMWDETTRDFIPRPAKVLIDRLEDLINHPDYAEFKEIWDGLNATRKQKIKNALVKFLGRARWRNQGQSIVVEE